MYICDEDGKIIYANKKFKEYAEFLENFEYEISDIKNTPSI